MVGSIAASYIEKNINDYKGLILLGSYSTVDFSNDDIKILSVYGENDLIMNREKYDKYKENLGEEKRKETLKSTEFFCKSWGKEGQEGDIQPEICEFPERYLKYQNAIREIIGEGNLFPIEFDYIVWK